MYIYIQYIQLYKVVTRVLFPLHWAFEWTLIHQINASCMCEITNSYKLCVPLPTPSLLGRRPLPVGWRWKTEATAATVLANTKTEKNKKHFCMALHLPMRPMPHATEVTIDRKLQDCVVSKEADKEKVETTSTSSTESYHQRVLFQSLVYNST